MIKECRQKNTNFNIFSILTFRPPLPARLVPLQCPPSYLTYSSALTPSSDPASRGFSFCTRRASRTWACWHICSPFWSCTMTRNGRLSSGTCSCSGWIVAPGSALGCSREGASEVRWSGRPQMKRRHCCAASEAMSDGRTRRLAL